MGNKRFARQGVLYLFAGASAALIEFILFQGLYTAVGLNVSLSNVIAVVVATVYNFAVNRSLTFKSKADPKRSAVRYGILFSANLLITTAAITAMVSFGVSSAIAKIIMQVCVVVWNYFLYRTFVFA